MNGNETGSILTFQLFSTRRVGHVMSWTVEQHFGWKIPRISTTWSIFEASFPDNLLQFRRIFTWRPFALCKTGCRYISIGAHLSTPEYLSTRHTPKNDEEDHGNHNCKEHAKRFCVASHNITLPQHTRTRQFLNEPEDLWMKKCAWRNEKWS